MKWKIPLYRIFTDKEDEKSIARVLSRGMDWAIGPEILEFERKIANYVGIKYCVTFNSGTSAGHAALLALNINSGEILVPSFTFIATANWPLMVNSKPKFTDIDEKRFGMDPKSIVKKISKKTKAIIPIHYGGLSCEIKEIKKISSNANIPLIEDCAEALGTKIDGKSVGVFGKMSIFSFAPNKILTTGEGGAVCTNSKKLFEKLQLIRSHGRESNNNYFKTNQQPNYVSIGYNWRMSSMTAALGNSQFKKLDKILQLRKKHAKVYDSTFNKIEEIITPYTSQNEQHVYQLYTIRIKDNKTRKKLQQYLSKKGIMTKIFFDPIHLSNYYKNLGYEKNQLPVTEKIGNTILSLPIFPGLKKEEITYICESVKEFFE
tara:strand:- start:10673 stop:11797 length:1125 start_codon:yes stop_codon:yes gene_type:complete